MALTDTAIRNAKKASEKAYKLPDEKGLLLFVTPAGGKLWRFNYRFGGKQKTLALGRYPDVPLVRAREKRDEARRLVADGIDPSEHRKATKSMQAGLAANTFEIIGREWYSKTAPKMAEVTKKVMLRWLEKEVFPILGSKPIASLGAPDLLVVIRRIEGRGATDIARRVHNLCGRIFRYAIGHGKMVRDPSRDIELRDILPPAHVQHHSSVTDPKEVGGLMRAIDCFTGSFTTQCALRLAPLVFTRPGELRQAEWSEFDFEKSEWRIPASKMKMKEQHIVPLARQVVAILREIQSVTGRGRYVFPGERTHERPMSGNTINAALRRLGYAKEEMTGHGFRSMASTLLHELGLPHAVIESQLAHGERNKVSAAYNFAKYLPERRKMMQQWADYLDKLKVGAEVIPLHGNAA